MLADLFFDLDRTLWDFDANSKDALREIYLELALPGLSDAVDVEDFIAVYEVENERCWAAYRQGQLTQSELRPLRFRRAIQELGIPEPPNLDQLAEHMGEAYVQRAPYRKQLIAGALEVCQRLKEKGHRMFILTNGFEEVQHIKMEHSGLSPYFDAVYTSDALGHKKPKREAFESVLQMTQSSTQKAIMIGDDLECDIFGAKSAGWRQIHYDPSDGERVGGIWHRIKRLEELLELPLESDTFDVNP